MRLFGCPDARFDRSGVERTERGLDDARLRGIGDVSGVVRGVGVLAEMLEPVSRAVAFEAGELSRRHDLDGPHLRHGNRKQQAGSAAGDGSLVRCPQPAGHVEHHPPFRANMAGQ